MIKRIAADRPAFEGIEELDHLHVETGNGGLWLPAFPAVGRLKDVPVEIDDPTVEQVSEIDRADGGITARGHARPMQSTISRVVGGGTVARGPAMLCIEKEQIQDCPKWIVLDPGHSSVGGVEESVAGGPAVKWIDESDRIYLARHRDDGPISPSVGRVRELADISEERRGSNPAFVRGKCRYSLEAEPGRNWRLLDPAGSNGVDPILGRRGNVSSRDQTENEAG